MPSLWRGYEVPGILVVEDEPDIADAVRLALTRDEIGPVFLAGSVEAARDVLSRSEIAAVIIDIGLPDGNGLELALEMRSGDSDLAIVFLSARDTDADKLAGFGVGADDYIVKPFNPLEVSARIRALLRRTRHGRAGAEESITIGQVRVTPGTGVVEVGGEVVELRPLELKLLVFLAENRGLLFTASELYERVWNRPPLGLEDENNVRVHIRRLRERIEEDPADPRLLVTVRGMGYRLESD